ncbi:Vacuolar ATPase assembly integral membrane protein vma21 [Psilocybe cubensis]|uniref:Vacuolar ATPase assembly integral membrane protein VMA21 n=2 Tax=Psilocybe cubensis TaxID=181762 RepID=A0A8H8CL19_PSICU|nr:Vacuolar ATPase assembly integral membrane protein vma21 [Psilocybe cubensis]KAH9482808.1 Vacuolar ATPase assembly integral membrane protein vma21 [Psilocybe cubensis]
MSEQVAVSKINADAAAGGVLFKLIIFSVSLGVIPISSYFLSLKYLWNENATFAAITAVVSANVVLVAYIISAIREDRQTAAPKEQKETPETKKNK